MLRRIAPLLVFGLCAPVFAQTPLPESLHGSDKLTAFLNQVGKVQAGITTLEASFELKRMSRLLVSPSISQGKFYFRAPDQVRWEYLAPRPMTVLVGGGVVTTYRPAEKRAERIEIGRIQRKFFRIFGAGQKLEELKRYFSFELRDAGEERPYVLLLQPTAHTLKKRLKQVELEIDHRTFMPISVAYTEADGDITDYTFTHVVTNKPLSDALFQLDLPPDVQVLHLKSGASE